MNRVGVGGRGESAWLGWFLADVLKTMRDLAEVMGNSEQAVGYMQKREDLARRMEESAWDGSWYLRATFDDGSLIGSAGNAEARIDSIPQSWARLSGAAEEERVRQALDAVWERLVREDEGLVQLFDPPFDHSNPSPGYLQGYPPGVRENGGQYTHAAVWYAMALARSGQGERASKILRMLNPIERTRDADAVWRYGVEPYVIPADVYRLEGRVGHGGWSWYTGSAAWMYRAWVEEILGLKVRGGWLSFDPVIPSRWEGFHMLFRHGEALYDIRVENPERVERGIISVEQDGRPVPDGRIKLERALVKHRIFIRMGRG